MLMKTTILLKAKRFFLALLAINGVIEKDELVRKALNSSFVPLESKVCLSIIRSAEVFNEFSHDYLAPFEITPTQVEIIKLLYFSGGRKLTQGQITHVSFISKANISSQLIKLENLGYIYREVNVTNRREKLISLTSLGEGKLYEITEKYENKDFRGIICKKDSEELIRILADFRKNIKSLNEKLKKNGN